MRMATEIWYAAVCQWKPTKKTKQDVFLMCNLASKGEDKFTLFEAFSFCMKVLVFVGCIVFSGVTLFGQIQTNGAKAKIFPIGEYGASRSGRTPAPEVFDTIWSDDFSSPGSWNVGSGPNEWSITDSLDSNLLSQGFDTILNSTSGGKFAFIDSDVNGPDTAQDAFLTMQNGVDCSSRSHVWLTFETYLAQFQETREIHITIDNGASWDTLVVLSQFSPNSISANTYFVQLDISDIAANQSNVRIRFRYQGSWDWFWCVDDVALLVPPDHDLAIEEVYYQGISEPTSTKFYTAIPIKQAESDTLTFGMMYTNKGVTNPSNLVLRNRVDFEGNQVHADSVFPGVVLSGETNSLNFPVSYTPASGVGKYSVSFEVSSDSTDEFPNDNMRMDSFMVSLNEYRRDNDSVDFPYWVDVQNSWEMLVRYELFVEDTVEAVSVFFPYDSITGRGISEGNLISYYVYSDTDLNMPVAVNEFYPVSASNMNSWITLHMGSEPLPAGNYFVGFKVYTDSASVGSNSLLNTQTPSQSVLIRKDASDATDPWIVTTEVTPFVRMYTANDMVCDSANLVISSVVVDTVSPGRIEISVNGGTPPYSFEWTGDSNYYSTSQNAQNILHQGVYTVVVTDLVGCQATKTDTVMGIVSIPELKRQEALVYPNPNSGEFFIEIDEGGKFDVVITNSMGKTVWNQKVTFESDSPNKIQFLPETSGIHFIQICNERDVFMVTKIIIF
jgi:hypothetical protein